MGDMNEVLFLPELLRRLQERAPNISLTVQHLAPSETIRALEASAVDFAVSALIKHSKSVHSLELAKDRMVCVMRKDHPAATGRLTARDFLALRHLRIVQSAGDTRRSSSRRRCSKRGLAAASHGDNAALARRLLSHRAQRSRDRAVGEHGRPAERRRPLRRPSPARRRHRVLLAALLASPVRCTLPRSTDGFARCSSRRPTRRPEAACLYQDVVSKSSIFQHSERFQPGARPLLERIHRP